MLILLFSVCLCSAALSNSSSHLYSLLESVQVFWFICMELLFLGKLHNRSLKFYTVCGEVSFIYTFINERLGDSVFSWATEKCKFIWEQNEWTQGMSCLWQRTALEGSPWSCSFAILPWRQMVMDDITPVVFLALKSLVRELERLCQGSSRAFGQ